MTTSELIYEYRKGEGWVANQGQWAEGVDRSGVKWRVYARLACKGEIWDACTEVYSTPQAYVERFIEGCVVWNSVAEEDQVHDPNWPFAYVLVKCE